MKFPDFLVGNGDEGGVLDLVDAVVADHGRPETLGDQQDVVALQKSNKTCRSVQFTIS